MSPDVTLALLAGVPVLVLMLLRVNATLVFLSACLGAVLLQFVGADANDFFAMFLPSLAGNNLKLALLLLPVVLTTVFMIKTVQGSKLVFNLLPALGFGFLLTLLVVPLLPGGESFALRGSQTWHMAQQLQSLVIGVSALLCLLFLWMQRPKGHHDGKHGKHHKSF
jgi:hypothetical protein